MAIKTIEYEVDLAGITPATEQFAGTQGDHRVTEIAFEISNELYTAINEVAGDGAVMYRFDVYDGEGGVWSREASKLNNAAVSIELEERHTRHGGKIEVYLIITALSADGETQTELYSFPAVLRLKNRAEGVFKEGESYESITTLAQGVRNSAVAAENANKEVQLFAAEIEEKLKKGEFDGADGISATHSWNGTVLTVTSASGTSSADLKGEKGDVGPAGKDAATDQTYNAESENAQSGTAVAEAIQNSVQKVKGNGHTYQVYAVGDTFDECNDTTLEVERNDFFETGLSYGKIPYRQKNGNLHTNTPIKDIDCANKKYVDEAVKNISIGDIDVDVTNKVDKIPSNESKILEDIKGSLGAYVSNTNYEGDFLARVHYNWEPYTIPYRLASGQIHVGMSGWDEINGVSKIFQDAAVPKSYLAMVRSVLENNITNVKTVAETANTNANNALTNANTAKSNANNALTEANRKKLTSSYTKAKTTLDYNSLYILWSNSGNADIELYNSATGARVKDTASENLPSAKVAVLFLPTSSTEVTSAETSKDVSRRCLYFGVTGTPSMLNMNVTSKQFVVESGEVYFTPSSSGVSVFKIAL